LVFERGSWSFAVTFSQIKLNRGTAYSGSPFPPRVQLIKSDSVTVRGPRQRNFCQKLFFLFDLPSDLFDSAVFSPVSILKRAYTLRVLLQQP